MRPLTKEWIDKGEGDRQVCEDQLGREAPVYDAVCFHAQQCAEKYLKALLVEHDTHFPKTHDLEALTSLALSQCPRLTEQVDELRFLSAFAVEIRYPGIRAGKEDAERCWEAAWELRREAREALGIEEKVAGPAGTEEDG